MYITRPLYFQVQPRRLRRKDGITGRRLLRNTDPRQGFKRLIPHIGHPHRISAIQIQGTL